MLHSPSWLPLAPLLNTASWFYDTGFEAGLYLHRGRCYWQGVLYSSQAGLEKLDANVLATPLPKKYRPRANTDITLAPGTSSDAAQFGRPVTATVTTDGYIVCQDDGNIPYAEFGGGYNVVGSWVVSPTTPPPPLTTLGLTAHWSAGSPALAAWRSGNRVELAGRAVSVNADRSIVKPVPDPFTPIDGVTFILQSVQDTDGHWHEIEVFPSVTPANVELIYSHQAWSSFQKFKELRDSGATQWWAGASWGTPWSDAYAAGTPALPTYTGGSLPSGVGGGAVSDYVESSAFITLDTASASGEYPILYMRRSGSDYYALTAEFPAVNVGPFKVVTLNVYKVSGGAATLLGSIADTAVCPSWINTFTGAIGRVVRLLSWVETGGTLPGTYISFTIVGAGGGHIRDNSSPLTAHEYGKLTSLAVEGAGPWTNGPGFLTQLAGFTTEIPSGYPTGVELIFDGAGWEQAEVGNLDVGDGPSGMRVLDR